MLLFNFQYLYLHFIATFYHATKAITNTALQICVTQFENVKITRLLLQPQTSRNYNTDQRHIVHLFSSSTCCMRDWIQFYVTPSSLITAAQVNLYATTITQHLQQRHQGILELVPGGKCSFCRQEPSTMENIVGNHRVFIKDCEVGAGHS